MFTNFDWLGAMRSSPVMVIILLCSVVTLGFALERALYFWRRRGRPDAFFRGDAAPGGPDRGRSAAQLAHVAERGRGEDAHRAERTAAAARAQSRRARHHGQHR